MTKEEIIQNNVLIAEFMGTEIKVKSSVDPYKYQVYGHQWAKEGLKYDYDWNWLMDVVEKVEATDNGSSGKGYIVSVKSPSGVGFIDKEDVFQMPVPCDSRTLGESRIESVWKAIVEFIKWYNENKKTM